MTATALNVTTAIIALVLTIGVESAEAQPYVFVSALSHAKIEASGIGGPVSDSTSALGFFGAGYRFSRHIGLEAAYLDPGTSFSSDRRTQGATTISTLRSYETEGFGLSAVGNIPAGGWFDFIVRLGAYRLNSTTSTATSERTGATLVINPPQRLDNRFWAPNVGVGAQARLPNTGVTLRALLEFVQGNELDKLQIFSLQVGYTF